MVKKRILISGLFFLPGYAFVTLYVLHYIQKHHLTGNRIARDLYREQTAAPKTEGGRN
jgi:hypothetical protein